MLKSLFLKKSSVLILSMEGQVSPAPQSPATQTSTPQHKKDPFSLFGKIIAIVLVAVIFIGGGIVIGKKLNKPQDTAAKTQSDEMIAKEESKIPENTSPTAIPEPTKSPTKTITGGLSDGSTSFKPYALQVPDGWVESTEKTDITSKLILKKGENILSIYQAPMGGSICIYPGDKEGNFTQKYSKFEEITGLGGNIYRRSWDEKAGTITYTFCQKGQDESFGTFTTFGGVILQSPNPTDTAVLEEADAIVASLKTQ